MLHDEPAQQDRDGTPDTGDLRRALGDRLAARDRAGAISLALAAVRDRGLPILELYDEVLAPVLIDVGNRWQEGAISVWQEHLATQTVRTIVESLTPDVIASATASKAAMASEAGNASGLDRIAILACPPGEQHDLGLRMLADRFTLAGWNAVFLGADTPELELIDAAKNLGAKAIVLSSATHFQRVCLREQVDRLRAAVPDLTVWVGGAAFATDRSGWAETDFIDEATAFGAEGE
jgi:MerR family transcriptional regulator, light-induced transcriptional regulator